MKINRSLACFACGVVCTMLFAFAHSWGMRKAFEQEAWQHGAGYFELSVFDVHKHVWHWFDRG